MQGNLKFTGEFAGFLWKKSRVFPGYLFAAWDFILTKGFKIYLFIFIFVYAICLLGFHLKLLSKNINQQYCLPRVLKAFIFRSKFFYEGFKKSEGERVKNFCQDFWKIFKAPLTLLQIKSLSPHSSISAFLFSITSCGFLPRYSNTYKQNKKN